MPKAKARRTCEICGVREVHSEKPLFYASFPMDETRCKEWVRVIGNSDLVYIPLQKLSTIKYVCGSHFRSKDFNKNGNRLKRCAVPCLNLKSTPLSEDLMSEFPVHVPNTFDSSHKASTSKGQCSSETAASISHTEQRIQDCPSEAGLSSSKEGQLLQLTDKCGSDADASGSHSEQKILDSLSEAGPSTHKCPKKYQKRVIWCKTEIAASMSDSELKVQETETGALNVASTKTYETETRGVKRKITDNEELTPRKKKLVERLKKTKCTLNSLRKSCLLVDKIQSPVLKELIINSCANEKRKPTARRWSIQQKLSCLAILKRSQKTYRYLSVAVTLPSVKTLQNILKKVPMKPGLSQAVLDNLKLIAGKKNEKNKVCSLVFDEMAIKSRLLYNEADDIVEGFEDLGEYGRTSELADHALVFLLQGLRQKTKQPIAFYFTKGTISSSKLAMIIKNIIIEVTASGFTILNTVCDQGPTNMGALKILREASGPSKDGSDHYFQLAGRIVYIMYDIPHLFKSIRNNFLNTGHIILDGKKGNWKHLVQTEEINNNFLYFSKITKAHIRPKYREKMRVKYAAQVLSNTVSAILKLLSRAEVGEKSNDLLSTAHVVEELDQLFDVTNGPSGPKDIKRQIRQNVSIKTNHMERWAYFIKLLKKTKFVNKDGVESKHIKCIDGYILSLKSLRDIWVTVKSMGYKYLNLRNLNQDALENLFGVIRQHSPTNRNPTATHFIAALKTAVVTGLTAPHSRGANCENDNKKLLSDFQDFVFGESKTSQDEESLIPQSLEDEKNCEAEGKRTAASEGCDLFETDFPTLDLPEIDEEELSENDFSLLSHQPTIYVAGYLAKNILKKIKCDDCKLNITVETPGDNPIYLNILLREWWQNKFSLTYPSVVFCKTIHTLIETTEKELLPQLHERNIGLLGCTLYSMNVKTLESSFTCPTHKKEISKMCFGVTSKLFIRRQCQRVNQSLASKEEDLASLNKMAEQQGKAK